MPPAHCSMAGEACTSETHAGATRTGMPVGVARDRKDHSGMSVTFRTVCGAME